MSRIPALDLASAQGKTATTLAAVHKQLGATPNLFRVAAQAPAVLEALVGLYGAVGQTSLGARCREAIALTVAEANGCDYCLSAHSVLGARAGLDAQDIAQARDAAARGTQAAARLRFARQLVLERGRISERALEAVREAGVSDAEILEVVAIVVLNIFTNYINLVADTDIDFPVVRSSAR
jgi:uncharacterized peroxidase-related enzyme